MQLEMVSGLLLPLGMWLILSASTPAQFHRRLSASALLLLAIAFLSYAAFGFALSHAADESSLALTTYSGQRWFIAGTQGFFLQGMRDAASLEKFLQGLPIVLSGALLVAGLLAHRTRTAWQATLVLLITGVLLPLAACWMWGGGWVQTLGNSTGILGGAVDLGHISTLGVVVGAASLAWLVKSPRRELLISEMPDMPVAEFPIRAVAGVLCVLIAASAFASTNDAAVPLMQFVNTSVVVSVSILTAGAYAIFATRKPDTLSAARAALGSVFAASAGGAVLPFWALLVCGIVCGLLATIGYYAVHEKLRWTDDNALVTSVFVPAGFGMLLLGAANGTSTAITLLALQVIALVSIGGMAYCLTSGLMSVTQRLKLNLSLPLDVAVTPTPDIPATSNALGAVAIASAELMATGPEINVTYTPAQTFEASNATDIDPEATRTATDLPTPPSNASRPVARQSRLLGWLRRKTDDTLPRAPRKVAYPYRLGGRRMVSRPITQSGGDTSESTKS